MRPWTCRFKREGSFWRRLLSREGFTSVSHVFVMEWSRDPSRSDLGLLIAGAIAAWVPESFWQHFFFVDHPILSTVWGPIVGPFVAIVSFVCSIGNVPLAAVLWNGGISFGGVVAFIFADLLIIPILNIYRKYYGTAMMLTLLGTFYAAMVAAGYLVELIFGAASLIPSQRSATVMHAEHFVELHHLAQYRLRRAGGAARRTVRDDGRHPDAAHDGRLPGRG